MRPERIPELPASESEAWSFDPTVATSVSELGPMNIVTGLPDLSLACTKNESGTTLMLVNPDRCRLLVTCCLRLDPLVCALVVDAGVEGEPEFVLAACAATTDETVVKIAAATRVV